MPTSQYATFEVAGQLFGVEVEAVQEVLSFSEYTGVPLASPAVGGLFNLRGQVIAAVDLRAQLRLPPPTPPSPVMKLIPRRGDQPGSLLVHRIGEGIDL